MTQQRVDTGGLCIGGAAVILWIAAAVTIALPVDPFMGLLLGLAASTATAAVTLRRWHRKNTALFVLGYHAGFHDAADNDCPYPARCTVLDFSEASARRYGQGA